VDHVTSCWNPEQLKSFFDGVFELSAHLVVANLVKKKDAILVNLPREKKGPRDVKFFQGKIRT
jgi:hypothetical protein